MKKVFLALTLLAAGTVAVLPLSAKSPVQQQANVVLPKPVKDAFAVVSSQYAAAGYILTNVQWTKSANTYSASFLVVDMNSDNIFNGSAAWLANGRSVSAPTTGGSTPE